MASSSLHIKLLTSLVFISTILNYPTKTTSQGCPYPCYPPPTGPGIFPPVTTTPPAPPVFTAPPAFFPPPVFTAPPGFFAPPVFTAPPATGYLPFNPPLPYFSGVMPPPEPPEPILPWIPYYYRKPPHQDHCYSIASRGSPSSTNAIIIIISLIAFSFVYN